MGWIQWFASLPDGSRVLDVATGNGIVLRYAARSATAVHKTFELTGVDLSDIDPVRHVADPEGTLKQVRFIGEVAAEHLPFGDAAFDALTSQYGLEYADLPMALREAARVLSPGGQLRWLAHCAGSEIVAQHAVQIDEVDFLVASAGPLDAMRKFVAAAAERGDMRSAMEGLLAAFASAERFCRERPPARVVRQVCGELAEVARRWSAYDPADLERMIVAGDRELQAHRARIDDFVRAVLTPPRLQTVRTILSQPEWVGAQISALRVGNEPVSSAY